MEVFGKLLLTYLKMTDKLYTVRQSAEMLWYSIKTIRNLLKKWQINYINIWLPTAKKQSIRIKDIDLQGFINNLNLKKDNI